MLLWKNNSNKVFGGRAQAVMYNVVLIMIACTVWSSGAMCHSVDKDWYEVSKQFSGWNAPHFGRGGLLGGTV